MLVPHLVHFVFYMDAPPLLLLHFAKNAGGVGMALQHNL
jgi:hypothetical protein